MATLLSEESDEGEGEDTKIPKKEKKLKVRQHTEQLLHEETQERQEKLDKMERKERKKEEKRATRDRKERGSPGAPSPSRPSHDFSVSILVIGDEASDHKGLVLAYKDGTYPEATPLPTDVTTFCKRVVHGAGLVVNVNVWYMPDYTLGAEECEGIRSQYFLEKDCILLCFSVRGHASFDQVVTKLEPEVLMHAPTVPVVLVGTNKERRDKDDECITWDEGVGLSKRIRAASYVECSARQGEGIDAAFNEGIRWCLHQRRRRERKSSCKQQ